MKWTAERTESFLSDAHGRDHVSTAEMALDEEGKFLALRVKTLANMGAYLSTFAPCIPTYLYATLLAGVYKTPLIYAEVKAVFTNTVPVDAYRGAGRPEATFLLERLVDVIAHDTGIDPVTLRRNNFIPADAFPYQTPVALQYDSGNYQATLDAALKAGTGTAFPARRAAAAAKGRLRGIGISTYIEACGIAPSAVVGSLGARAGLYEVANVRVHPTGSVSVFTGAHSHGQGHETTFAQLVAEQLGVPFEQVEVVHGDTAKIPFGMGTYGSRSLAVGGSAMVKAMDKIVAKGKRIAAHLMEASVEDIEFKDGAFSVAGTDKVKTLAEISLAAYVPHNYPIDELEPGLEETAFYDPKNFTFPAGCHVAEIEIDPDTGVTTVVNFIAVDDVGRVINPMIVEGQVQGGVAQGIGQALLENAVYDGVGPARDRLDDGLHHAARGRSARDPGRDRDHPLHAQPARREGLRRSGRDRQPARDHQRGGERARRLRRAAYRHAGEPAEDMVDHPGRPAPHGRRVGRAGNGREHDVRVRLSEAGQPAGCAEAPFLRPGGQGAGRRHDLHPGAEAAACQALDAGRSRRPRALLHPRGRGQGDDRGDDHPRHRRGLGGGEEGDPGARRPRRRHRRQGGAPSRDHRRLARQRRSYRLLSFGGARARRDHPHEQARDRGGRLFPGHVHDRARAGRADHRSRVPGAREGGLHEVSAIPASRYAIVGVFVAKGSAGVRVAVTGAGQDGVFRHKAMEEALGKSFSAAAIANVPTSAEGLNGDIHASPEYRAHLVGVMARRAVAAAG